jgi:hypothetical protein
MGLIKLLDKPLELWLSAGSSQKTGVGIIHELSLLSFNSKFIESTRPSF